jgi:hypothetical protein
MSLGIASDAIIQTMDGRSTLVYCREDDKIPKDAVQNEPYHIRMSRRPVIAQMHVQAEAPFAEFSPGRLRLARADMVWTEWMRL